MRERLGELKQLADTKQLLHGRTEIHVQVGLTPELLLFTSTLQYMAFNVQMNCLTSSLLSLCLEVSSDMSFSPVAPIWVQPSASPTLVQTSARVAPPSIINWAVLFL